LAGSSCQDSSAAGTARQKWATADCARDACASAVARLVKSCLANPDGTKKGIGRPVGSQGVKVKAKPSVFSAASRASSLAAIPKIRKGPSKLRAAAKDSGDDARDDNACSCSESNG
jgi:hypothetical protein